MYYHYTILAHRYSTCGGAQASGTDFPLAMELLQRCRALIAQRIARNEALPTPDARAAADLETEMQKNRLLIGLVEKVRYELEQSQRSRVPEQIRHARDMQKEVQTLVQVYFRTVALQYGLDEQSISNSEDLWRTTDAQSERPDAAEKEENDVNQEYRELRSQIVSKMSVTSGQPAPEKEQTKEEPIRVENDELKQKLELLAERVERVEQRVAQFNAQQQRESEQQKVIEQYRDLLQSVVDYFSQTDANE